MSTAVPMANLKQASINNTPNISNDNDEDNTNNMKHLSNLLATLAPHHQTSLNLGKFNPLVIKQFLHNSITQLNSNKYFNPLFTLDRKSISNLKAQQ